MRFTRRKALLFGSSVGISTLSGCAKIPFVGPELTLTLLNYDSDRHFLEVEILRAEGGERSESIVFSEEFELPPPEDGSGGFLLEESNILESKKYVVRASLTDNRSVREKYLFYPDCASKDQSDDTLYIDIHREEEDEQPYIKYSQAECSTDSWWY